MVASTLSNPLGPTTQFGGSFWSNSPPANRGMLSAERHPINKQWFNVFLQSFKSIVCRWFRTRVGIVRMDPPWNASYSITMNSVVYIREWTSNTESKLIQVKVILWLWRFSVTEGRRLVGSVHHGCMLSIGFTIKKWDPSKQGRWNGCV